MQGLIVEMSNHDAKPMLLDALVAALVADGVLTGAAVQERATSWIDSTPLQALAIVRPRTTT
ncbi:MAG: hypothetical protein ACK4SA_13120, partial [Caldilinea sp.]